MNERQKSYARPNTRPDNSHPAITLRKKPICCAARIQNGLPDSSYGASNVRRDQIFRSFEVRGPAMMMIWQAQPEGCDSRALKHAAQRYLRIPLRIPLRQNDAPGRCRCKESSPDGIVFGYGVSMALGNLRTCPSKSYRSVGLHA